jgi:hypothetical protein
MGSCSSWCPRIKPASVLWTTNAKKDTNDENIMVVLVHMARSSIVLVNTFIHS